MSAGATGTILLFAPKQNNLFIAKTEKLVANIGKH